MKNKARFHKKTPDEIKEVEQRQKKTEEEQQQLIDNAKKIYNSDDFQALKIDYEKTRDAVIDELIDSIDKYTIDDLGLIAFQFLHRIKYLNNFIKKVETKAQV